jgi:formylglycine-generating enzyme required for sulfatase activity
MAFRLIRCLAKAVAKNGVKFAANLVPGGGAVYDIAADAWEDFRRDRNEDVLRAEVQALAQAAPEQVCQEVQAAVAAEAATLPTDVQQKLAAYLNQVPAMIRRSLQRPSDPGGKTAPAGLPLRGPEDLIGFLPPRPPRFKPGERPLPGVDWVLEELLGIGGFGEVWKARHPYLKNKPPVALKFCLDDNALPSLRNEAGVLDQVMGHGRHPGIVPLLHTYLSAKPPCLEYEYVEGGDLAGLIRELHEQGKATCAIANDLFLRLVDIVAAAHQADPPVVHDDLKPSNVLVRRTAEGHIELKVTDYGIGGLAVALAAREARLPTRSRQELLTEAVRGAYTPLYAAPEQMSRRRGEPPDPRDDVHALGVIWYQLLTGDLGMLSVPTDWHEQVRERGLDDELRRVLASCISPRAEKRPASALTLAQLLRQRIHQSRETDRPPEQGEIGGAKIGRVAARASVAIVATSLKKAAQAVWTAVKSLQPGRTVTGPLDMQFAWCSADTFTMGSSLKELMREEHESRHEVTLSKGFYLGIFPVTQAQWQAVMGKNPSHFKGDQRPVDNVSWYDCQEFCRKLSEREGKRYRLPTEAEWEYACRAETTTPFYFGKTIGTHQANYDGNEAYGKGKKGIYRQETTLVGSFPANEWSFFDMHGNIWEWCQDGYGPYPFRDITDPQGVVGADTCVLRGGSWICDPWYCRSASRGNNTPDHRAYDVGCRVVLCSTD